MITKVVATCFLLIVVNSVVAEVDDAIVKQLLQHVPEIPAIPTKNGYYIFVPIVRSDTCPSITTDSQSKSKISPKQKSSKQSSKKIDVTNFSLPQMRGVNRAGLEYSCVKGFGVFDGPSDEESIKAIKKWKADVVRLPLNEDCWLGNNGVNSAYSGENYRTAVSNYIKLLRKNGLSVVLDLHWSAGIYDGPGNISCVESTAKCEKPMPDAENAAKFWKSVAKDFKGDDGIIFDLFNNPFPDSAIKDKTAAWKCWKNGGSDCPGFKYKVAGMQNLVNAVRDTGATNPLMIGGIRKATDFSKWLDYVPKDPKGKIIASWHSFKERECNTESCWESEIAPITKKYPVIVGEMGEGGCTHAYIDKLMDWLDKKQISYIGWTWNTWDCSSGPSLIKDFNGTPTEFGKGLYNRMTRSLSPPQTTGNSIPEGHSAVPGSSNSAITSATAKSCGKQLRGVNRSGAEYSCVKGFGIFEGPIDDSAVKTMKSWKINVVRVPLNEDCWLGINGHNAAYTGETYRKAVIDYVNILRKNDLKVILDLHWTDGLYTGNGQGECVDKTAKCQKPMPDKENAPKFWESVAKQFKDDDGIIFDLFNEPFPDMVVHDKSAAWKCWRDGGSACSGFQYEVAGMQDLVTAVRSTGAKNLVMVGGITWANDLSQWLNYMPEDKAKNIAASWHSYNFNSCNNKNCWESQVAPVAAKYPVIVGEIGEHGCSHSYIDGLMDWLDEKKISYVGWTWNTWDCSSGPALITDYNGTPTNFGAGLKEHLAKSVENTCSAVGATVSGNKPSSSSGSATSSGNTAVAASNGASTSSQGKSCGKQLRGVNRSGAEYSCVKGFGIFEGPIDDSAVKTMKSWKINVVRVPLNEDCWLGINGHNATYTGETYRKAVIDYVNILRKNDLKVILDLHWTDGLYTGNGQGECVDKTAKCQKPMPDKENAPKFWESVAKQFKDDDGIIFDLFNEPFPDMVVHDKSAAWKCWRDGGSACSGFQYEVAGMQDLVTAVRSTGAKNLVMVGGITWANDLSQWLNYMPEDKAKNIAASWHSYNFNSCNNKNCWESQVAPVAAKYPVIVGEIGEHGCSHSYIDGLMDWLDEKKISYVGWTWNTWDCSSGPALITDYNGTPTNFGAGLKEHLAKSVENTCSAVGATVSGNKPSSSSGSATSSGNTAVAASNGASTSSQGKSCGKQLRGVNRSGAEYSCVKGFGIFEGPIDDSAVKTMKSWKINVVRVPLNEDCWLGINGHNAAYTGETYRKAVIDYVNILRKNDLKVILDLHWTDGLYTGNGQGECVDKTAKCQKPMPDKENAPKFWESVAKQFKDDDGIIFDLFNEPFPDMVVHDKSAAWKCWRDGGSACSGFQYEVAGMQDLVTAVRSTGAKNLVMVGGITWANDLSQWLNYMPEDKAKNIAASWHSYNFNSCNNKNCWESQVAPVAAKYPVIVGEIGEHGCSHSYIDGLMDWLDEKKISYVGWTWNTWDCSSGPALITDYNGTPTNFGAGLKEHLAKSVENTCSAVGATVSGNKPSSSSGSATSSGNTAVAASNGASTSSQGKSCGKQLRGVNRSGAEYSCVKGFGIFEGPIDDSAVKTMKSWKINVVRVPLNEDCWLGINGHNAAYTGETYRKAVIDYVNILRKNDLKVILDLHWTDGLYTGNGQGECVDKTAKCQKPMPDKENAPKFWESVAKQFKDDDGIIFDLFNEPFPDMVVHDKSAAWKCWRDGGSACSGFQYEVAGMQDLVTAVRSTGAKNLVMVGGITWANDLSQWLNYMPEDKAKNIAASWHSYNFNSCNNKNCWESQVAPVAAKYPVIVGEIGEHGCSHSYIDGLMDWLDEKKISYVGWTWNTWDCSSGPALITDYNGTPTNFGVGLKEHLAKSVENTCSAVGATVSGNKPSSSSGSATSSGNTAVAASNGASTSSQGKSCGKQLRGVNRSGAEYSCVKGFGIFEGPIDDSAVKTMKSWKINVVRVPLNEDCWLGINGHNAAYTGETYRKAVIDYVNILRKNDLKVILDLHWTDGLYTGNGQGECVDKTAKCQKPMPDKENAPKFWESVAKQFKDDDGIIFDLFNEPFPDMVVHDKSAAWKCWRDGGSACSGFQYEVAGMQDLVTAVRSTGAKNLVMVGGITWANDLSQWLNYMPEDKAKNIAASWHSYNFNSCNNNNCWESQVAPVAAKYPVIVGEIGEHGCSHSYIDGLMDWLDEKKISYVGWTWNTWDCSSGPALITDYNGTPTNFGVGLKEHLAKSVENTCSAVGATVSGNKPSSSSGSATSSGNTAVAASNGASTSSQGKSCGKQLRGVNRSGAEYSCVKGFGIFEGPIDDSAVKTMNSWKINVVRVPLNEDCWLGINGHNAAYTGETYRKAVIDYVNILRKNDLKVILDLHWTDGLYTGNGQGECVDKTAKCQKPMPDKENAPKFWESVAKQFKDDDGIIFDLFNEPFPDMVVHDKSAAWKCWRDGGSACSGFQYEVAGMQDLVTAVRSTGAKNLVMVGGITWANDLSQWLNYMPEDKAKNIAASWHSYNFNSCNNKNCWESQVAPVAAKYPVIVGEIGEHGCSHSYIDGLMDWLDEKKISYVGWTWNTWDCSSGPALITDYNGTPTNFGVGLKEHLAKSVENTCSAVGATVSGNKPSSSSGSATSSGNTAVAASNGASTSSQGKSCGKQLRGVNRSGAEYSCVKGFGIFEGPIDDSAVKTMNSWKINVVRVPLNEDCWLGINGHNAAYTGETYRKAVIDYVNILRKNDLKVILDLHWTDGLYTGNGQGECVDKTAKCQKPMPDKENAPKFWESVAKQFKDDDGIIFDLFNEPFPDMVVHDKSAAWKCWRDGGSACSGFQYEVAGMQDLVTAVRSTGAKNLVMVGGITWANDLSQWLNYMPEDKAKNIAASWHSYNFNSCNNKNCWESQVAPVAAKYPVIVGEIGEHGCSHSYIDGLMDWLDEKKISYVGWTWNTWDCSSGPALITDYNGTPTNFGAGLKEHLAKSVENTCSAVGATVSGNKPSSSSGSATSSGNTAVAASNGASTSSQGKSCGKQLRGVNRSGAEYSCVKGFGIFEGPIDDSAVKTMKSWKINVVRVPLNEDCWLGINGHNAAYTGETYRKAVIDYVNILRKNDLKVILDLHWTDGLYTGNGQGECVDKTAKCQKPMPDKENAPKFWESVAKQFKDDDGIIFDLFNEPFPDMVVHDKSAAWKCWRDGGSACSGFQYEVAGMQDLVTAVRSTGAKNLVMVGGITWANDLSQWLNYMPEDKAKNIAASWHSYNFNSCNNKNCWESQVAPVAAKYPVIVGEIGEHGCSHSYIDGLMDWLDEKKISYVGWTWNTWDCSSGPALITDYNGTPTNFGVGLKEHLAKSVENTCSAVGATVSGNKPSSSSGSATSSGNTAVAASNGASTSSQGKSCGKQLRGVNRSGAEYSCVKGFGIFEGPIDDSAVKTMKSWKINVVRVPLNEDCWLGINGHNAAYTGETYRKAVIDYVNILRKNDLKVILDLHWTDGLYTGNGQGECVDKTAKCQKPMPDKENAPKFWESVAKQFKDDDGIIFDLFNEPFPDMVVHDKSAAWKCWRDGGSACSGFQYEVAGMQDLVTAVRSTGAKNLVMVGGITWANDLSQWLNYMPEDKAKNIAASWHSYNFNSCNNKNCWESQVAPVAAKYPVIVGEIGEHGCSHSYIDGLMDWLDEKKISYVGWTWNTWDCSSGPALITDYNGTPTNFGVGLKEHLAKSVENTCSAVGATVSGNKPSSSSGSATSSGNTAVAASNGASTSSQGKSCGKQLRGVNRAGAEYSCVKGFGIFEGPIDDSAVKTMKSWKINVVRVPLNEDCWLGINGHNAAYTGETYRKAVIDYVNILRKNDLKVILDLHWTDGLYTGNGQGECVDKTAKCQKPMPDKENAPKFWESVAKQFKDDDGIIFDLFNEPFPDMVVHDKSAAWKCWRDGGSACLGFQYEVAGMQDLVTAVRSTGAKNLVMVGGITWANDLSQWLNYMPEDKAKNIAASWHSYNFNSCNNKNCWESQVAPVAAKYPVIVGEIGEHGCSHSYIDGLMDWLDEKKISYVGWTWNTWDCSSGPALITDYNGTPTNFGVGLKEHLSKTDASVCDDKSSTAGSTRTGKTPFEYVAGGKQLRGVNRSGTEYSCVGGYAIFEGPVDDQAVKNMKKWNINAVRIPLNEDCWFGINGLNPTYSGENYQRAIEKYVTLLRQNDLVVILDLHWTSGSYNGAGCICPNVKEAKCQKPMPDAQYSTKFWKSVAEMFSHDENVIFDLFNEPYPDMIYWDKTACWKCWRDGGSACSQVSYAVAGMQDLVNAVRSVGAKNPVMIGGINWASDLSQWKQYVPKDPMNRIVASWHAYALNPCNNTDCWETMIGPIAKEYPVVVGEIGETDCTHEYIDKLMAWMDKKQISYLAWTWNTWDCRSGPALITSYEGTPTEFGKGLMNHLKETI